LFNFRIGPLAQSVEQRTFNPWVVGSIPTGPTITPPRQREFTGQQDYYICVRSNGERTMTMVIILTGVFTTLAITPGIAYDPINLPKMLVLVTGSSMMIPGIMRAFSDLYRFGKYTLVFSISFLCTIVISMFLSDVPFAQQLWGVWGRSTGALSYFSFVILLLATAIVRMKSDMSLMRETFERLSYFITFYTLLQAGNLDPINWSQKMMVATLGNINFMSSFLGLATISMFSRVILEKITILAKIHYSLICFMNLFLIWFSGSIQGIAVFAAGAALTFTFSIRNKISLKAAVLAFFTFIIFGSVLFLGTLGLGPLSSMRQDTVLFRVDYWLAGLRMTVDNWLHGVGIDSYGDFYEQYRDVTAVKRTGPQRVSNTAHNIFLDVSSGAGIIALILFFALFLYAFKVIYDLIKRQILNVNDLAVASMFLGFFVFCMISINQIGVGIWGFIFLGYLHGISLQIHAESGQSRDRNSTRREYQGKKLKFVGETTVTAKIVISFFGLLGLVLSLPPNVTDAQMLNAVKGKNFAAMKEITSRTSSTTFHRNKYQLLLLDGNFETEAYEFARKEMQYNPRNDVSLRIVAYYEGAPRKLRVKALQLLRSRDPANLEFQTYIDGLLQSLKKS
jgi:O-antigen ligase